MQGRRVGSVARIQFLRPPAKRFLILQDAPLTALFGHVSTSILKMLCPV